MDYDIRQLMVELAGTVLNDNLEYDTVITQVGVRGVGEKAEAFFVLRRGDLYLGSAEPLFEDGNPVDIAEVMGNLGGAMHELAAFTPNPVLGTGPDGVIWVA